MSPALNDKFSDMALQTRQCDQNMQQNNVPNTSTYLCYEVAKLWILYVAVPDRNQILFHRVFRAHHRVRRAIALSFRLGQSSYALRGRIRYSCVYIALMSPTLSGSSALQQIEQWTACNSISMVQVSLRDTTYTGRLHTWRQQWMKKEKDKGVVLITVCNSRYS